MAEEHTTTRSTVEATHGLNCPNCGGVVPIPGGQVIVACPYCDMRSFVKGERGIQRYQVPHRVDRKQAAGSSDVLSEREERHVGIEETRRFGNALVELDLHLRGVRIEIHQPVRARVLRSRDRAPVEVDDERRIPQQRVKLTLVTAVDPIIGVASPEQPSVP